MIFNYSYINICHNVDVNTNINISFLKPLLQEEVDVLFKFAQGKSHMIELGLDDTAKEKSFCDYSDRYWQTWTAIWFMINHICVTIFIFSNNKKTLNNEWSWIHDICQGLSNQHVFLNLEKKTSVCSTTVRHYNAVTIMLFCHTLSFNF